MAHGLLDSAALTLLIYAAATVGLPALAMAATHPFPIHLVVTDVVMPGMRGPEVVARLLARQPSLRVLYISGYTDDVMTEPGSGGLGGPLLEKPFTPQALAARVRAVLDERVA